MATRYGTGPGRHPPCLVPPPTLRERGGVPFLLVGVPPPLQCYTRTDPIQAGDFVWDEGDLMHPKTNSHL